MNSLNSKRGITLIALIITIIVLLILVAVSLALVVGDNGVLSNAIDAVEQTDLAGAQEAFELALAGALTDYYRETSDGDAILTSSEYITIEMIRNGLGNSYQYCSKYSAAENTEDDEKTLVDMNGAIFLSKIGSTEGETIYKVTYDIVDGSITNISVRIMGDYFVDELTTENLGDYVNFEIDINEDGDYTNDWRIFYIDDSSDRVFLISADYLPNDSMYLDTTDEDGDGVYDETGLIPSESYILYWSRSFLKNNSSYSRTDLMSEVTNSLFMFNYSYYSNIKYYNLEAVLTLLNTKYWDGFVDNTYADYVIGSPTIEMWIASWNSIYGDELKLYCNNETAIGYNVGTSDTPTTYYVSSEEIQSTSGFSDTLYYPHPDTYEMSDGTVSVGYFLSAPTAINAAYLIFIPYCGGVEGRFAENAYLNESIYSSECSLRPVVSLKIDTLGTYNESNGYWVLSN